MENTLVVFFSHTGQNYFIGGYRTVQKGNASIIADFIHSKVKSDIFEIKTIKTYPEDYKKCCEEALNEQKNKIYPELSKYLDTIDGYKNIFLIYPCWYETMPQAVFTFLNHYDFSNKNIFPICTHEGSGMGKSVGDIRSICTNSAVDDGLAIQGTYAEKSSSSIDRWLKKLVL